MIARLSRSLFRSDVKFEILFISTSDFVWTRNRQKFQLQVFKYAQMRFQYRYLILSHNDLVIPLTSRIKIEKRFKRVRVGFIQ